MKVIWYVTFQPMPEKYDTIIAAIETQTTGTTMKFVKSRLFDAELKCTDNQAEKYRGDSSAFYINANSQNNQCYRCNGDHLYLKSPKKNVDRGRSYFRLEN
ncbi:hypothetical protein WA026_015943 [Henosepilachna vigintioctopunctata]|uniref:Uncharacterized protein n=1 Tax=Henosepilachna vigintioctopunctata TaxID=420089 RepID=A0AAW1U8E7_9CUCU